MTTTQPSLRSAVAERLGEAPQCRYGYPADQLERLLGERWQRFGQWSNGCTMLLCEGRSYDHETKVYTPSGCGPHGVVIYSYDIARFLAGFPVDD